MICCGVYIDVNIQYKLIISIYKHKKILCHHSVFFVFSVTCIFKLTLVYFANSLQRIDKDPCSVFFSLKNVQEQKENNFRLHNKSVRKNEQCRNSEQGGSKNKKKERKKETIVQKIILLYFSTKTESGVNKWGKRHNAQLLSSFCVVLYCFSLYPPPQEITKKKTLFCLCFPIIIIIRELLFFLLLVC